MTQNQASIRSYIGFILKFNRSSTLIKYIYNETTRYVHSIEKKKIELSTSAPTSLRPRKNKNL